MFCILRRQWCKLLSKWHSHLNRGLSSDRATHNDKLRYLNCQIPSSRLKCRAIASSRGIADHFFCSSVMNTNDHLIDDRLAVPRMCALESCNALPMMDSSVCLKVRVMKWFWWLATIFSGLMTAILLLMPVTYFLVGWSGPHVPAWRVVVGSCFAIAGWIFFTRRLFLNYKRRISN